MSNIAKLYANPSPERFSGTARVVGVDENHEKVRVVPDGLQVRKEIPVRVMTPLHQTLTPGNEVLVVEDHQGNFYIIGVLTQGDNVLPRKQVTAADGTYAAISTSETAPILGVYSNDNKLLFEYDPETKKAKIYSDADNVVFEAGKGNLEFKAAGNIRLKGHHVELSGRSGVALSAGQIFEKTRSGLTLKPGQVDVSGRDIKVSARRAGIFIEEVKNNIKTLTSKIGSVRLVTEKLETTAASIIEKAKDTYRTTENLSQIKAGRMRMLINRTFHLGSKTAVIKAKDDVKVKGEKIHLG